MSDTALASLLPLAAGVPIIAAGLTALGRRRTVWASTVMLLAQAAMLVFACVLVARTHDGTVLAHQVGAWVPGVAIPFAADAFNSLVLVVVSLLILVSSWFALMVETGRQRFYAPLVLVLQAGVSGALLTADIFNLFVFIEVMLLSSYGLLVISPTGRGSLGAVIGSRLYVTFNLFVSTLYLAGVGLIYGAVGSVNLAELKGAAASDPYVAAGGGIALMALLMKAAVVPTHGWLARAYPSTSPAITALFSGLHTKVSIYAVYRLYAFLYEGEERWLWIGIVLFSATMLFGVLGAVGEGRMRSILAFHMVSQIGYILLGVALFTYAGLVAGIFYLLHHMIVKASLFMSAGAIEERYGTDDLDQLRGKVGREPLLAAAFAMAALSLAGLPPFSGFIAKFTLIVASFDAGEWIAAAVALLVSLITLLSMLKIWSAVFAPTISGLGKGVTPRTAPGTGAPRDALLNELVGKSTLREGEAPVPTTTGAQVALTELVDSAPSGTAPGVAVQTAQDVRREQQAEDDSAFVPGPTPLRLVLPALTLALITLALGLGSQGLLALVETAANNLLDPSAYLEAVLGS